MKFENREVTWTTLELTGLLEDEDSHVHYTRTTKHLALHPYHLNNVQRGLNQILRSSLNSYDRGLKGFVLAFKNPKLLSNLGKTLYDSPFIHIDVEADFYLFHPTIGSFLKGIVKKKGFDHIIVLVHKIYTVSIPKPDNTEEWAGELVEIGQEVKCCVSQIDNRSKPPFICATLRSDYSQDCSLPNSINNIDTIDSAIENVKIEASANGISEDDSVSEKEKKKHQKKHKRSCEDNSNFVCKVESESQSNDNLLENDISTIVNKSVKKHQYQNMQDTTLNTDDFLNDLEDDNIPKNHKKSKKLSKLPDNDDTILNEQSHIKRRTESHIESRKAVKRENSVPLDSFIKTETKKRKKHTKKSKEFDSDSEIEEKVIKSEENTHKKRLNTDLVSNNLEDSVSKKHKKTKKTSMKMSDSEAENHIVKIKIEKQHPDKITNESQTTCNETTQIATQNFNKNLEISKRVKREVSIEFDIFEKERKKSHKKHMVTSQSKLVKIKTENVVNDASDTEETERKKSPKKHAKMSRDSNSEIRIKSENITNDISQTIKHDPTESQYMKNNISAMDSSLNNSDLDHVSKKSKKKKTPMISDSELEYPVKMKIKKI